MDDRVATNSPEAQKVEGRSFDVASDARRRLIELFPEIQTELGRIDFDNLKRTLGETIDSGKERFGLTWPGKVACFKTIQAPSMATLLPVPGKSVHFDSTDNLIIEGDNLEVLKLLQKPYLGQVKTIYIDPPYNTGNDFIYPDDYSESLQTYLQYTGQVDAEGRKFGTNADTEGRFHSRWLSMMYPRLYLARHLLRDDGLIFVSIDDSEIHNLRALMNEIFGEENRVESFVWKKSYGGGAKERFAVTQHEYVLLYAKNIDAVGTLWLPPDSAAEAKYYKYSDDKLETRGPFRVKPLEATKSMDRRDNLVFPIIAPDGSEVWPKRQWWWSKERVERALADDGLTFSRGVNGYTVSYKQYLRDESGVERKAKPFSVIDGPYTQTGTSDLAEWFDGVSPMQFPKPANLIKKLILTGDRGSSDGIILDFFAGSGTTAQATLELNEEDGGKRRFILVQLPEPTGNESYPTIADIAEVRAKRVIAKIADERDAELDLNEKSDVGLGFRVFRLAESNVKAWDSSVPHDSEALESQMSLNVNHLLPDRTDLDVLYEVLLKEGFPLSSNVTTEIIASRTVYSVAEGAFLICLDRKLDLDLLRTIAERQPERVLLLDEGFAGNDQLKTNAMQTFRGKNIVLRTL